MLSSSFLKALLLTRQSLSLLNRERMSLNRPGLSKQTERVRSWSIRWTTSASNSTTLTALSSHATLSLTLWTVRLVLQTSENLSKAREMKFMRDLSEKPDQHRNDRLTILNRGKLMSNP